MASLQTLECWILALEARLADVEGGDGDTLYKLHRAAVREDLKMARVLTHLGIESYRTPIMPDREQVSPHERTTSMVQYEGPEHSASASPLVLSRLPLSSPPITPHLPAGWSLPRDAGPRPWGTRFAVPPVVENKHHKRPTHGVRTKTTKYIDDGKEHTDTVNESYEDEEDE